MQTSQPSDTMYYGILGAFFALLFFSSWVTMNVFVSIWRKWHVDVRTVDGQDDQPDRGTHGLGLLGSGRGQK